ncbi:MAG TPA: hypothetical protein VF658_03710 [Pyrinomonadaceae bacterium]|jgi:hypothetical protein
MRLRKTALFLILGCLLGALSACSREAKVNSLKIGKDEKVTKTEDTFQPGETLYAVADITNAPSQGKARFRIVYEDVAGQKNGSMVPGAEKTLDVEGDNTASFYAKLPSDFPGGRYGLQVRLADKEDNPVGGQSTSFTVTGGSASKTPQSESNAPAAGNSNTESAGGVSIFRMKMTKHRGMPVESPGETTFSPADLIYVIFTIDNTIGGDAAFGKLYAEQVEGIEPGKMLGTMTETFPSAAPRLTTGFQLNPQELSDGAWAKGAYRFEVLYASDANARPVVLKSMNFTVE